MFNRNKVVTAGPEGFTVYYIDTQKHFNYEYHQPLLAHLQKLQLFKDSYKDKCYEQDKFSSYQNRLYKNAVYGLNSYTIDQLKKMDIREKLEIKKKHRLAQYILNQWKHEIICKLVDDFLSAVFFRSKWVRELVQYSDDIRSWKEINRFEFADLNLTKVDIALKLIEQKILPFNFFG